MMESREDASALTELDDVVLLKETAPLMLLVEGELFLAFLAEALRPILNAFWPGDRSPPSLSRIFSLSTTAGDPNSLEEESRSTPSLFRLVPSTPSVFGFTVFSGEGGMSSKNSSGQLR